MIEPTVRQILPGTDMVGESIVWDLKRGCVFWVDIVGRAIRRFDPVSGQERRWEAPELPTSIGLRADGGAIVGLTRRVALWDFGETFETLAVPEPDLPDNRLNEGKVAPDGSFWVGTMQNNVTESGASKDITDKAGRYYRIDASGRTTLLSPDRYGITNGMAWLPGRRNPPSRARTSWWSRGIRGRRLAGGTRGRGWTAVGAAIIRAQCAADRVKMARVLWFRTSRTAATAQTPSATSKRAGSWSCSIAATTGSAPMSFRRVGSSA
jgi:SMP-30/Gluconolactonase/LRE-like region